MRRTGLLTEQSAAPGHEGKPDARGDG
jgi:hypothetical protein